MTRIVIQLKNLIAECMNNLYVAEDEQRHQYLTWDVSDYHNNSDWGAVNLSEIINRISITPEIEIRESGKIECGFNGKNFAAVLCLDCEIKELALKLDSERDDLTVIGTGDKTDWIIYEDGKFKLKMDGDEDLRLYTDREYRARKIEDENLRMLIEKVPDIDPDNKYVRLFDELLTKAYRCVDYDSKDEIKWWDTVEWRVQFER